MGLIAMKGMSGGLLSSPRAAYAFFTQYDNVVPIWGIQKESELRDFLSYAEEGVTLDDELRAIIEKDKRELQGDFCRGCGYCMPCPQGIEIRQCARMSLMLRRAPSKEWLTASMQAEMKKIETCLHCNQCSAKCPYSLDTPTLLQKNYEDYQRVLSGETRVD